MNKDLNHLFEQARQSLKAEMPVQEMQALIHQQASPSLWTNQKIWIMSTTFFSILIVSSLFLWNNDNKVPQQEPKTTKTLVQTTAIPTTSNKALPLAPADNEPLPIITATSTEPTIPEASNQPPKPQQALTLTRLDSLEPQETFTEYTLEIRKDNSEQEIKKLQSELAQYGIHLQVKTLNYTKDDKIKRFKGVFKTDSLFCGSSINNYEFDVSGAFKTMQFTFRVAKDQNLKYLKIESDNFEETIECYDDEVIASTKEAQEINERIKEEMTAIEEAMAKAQEQMMEAQEDMIKLQNNILYLNTNRFPKLKHKLFDDSTSWIDITIPPNTVIFPKDIFSDFDFDFDALEWNEENSVELKEFLEDLKIDIKEARIEVLENIKGRQQERKERLLEKRLERQLERSSIEELEREAKALEKAAEKLRKAAEKKAKAAEKQRKKQ